MSDDPFVPELLLGAASVKPTDKRAIRDFIQNMFVRRPFPLHVNNLWNALYFGWTPEGYVSLPPERIESRTFGKFAPAVLAVPVGGFISIQSGAGKDVWAEVICKVGRDPRVADDGTVPPEIAGSGAPEPVDLDGEAVSILREALVLDWKAIGKPTDKDRARIERIRRRGLLDQFQHLAMNAVYSVDDADLDDTTFYARHLFTRHRAGLLAEFLTDDAGDEELWPALLNSLRAVADIASELPDLLSWNGYFFLKSDYEAMVADHGATSLAEFDYLENMFKAVAYLPSSRHDDRPTLTALEPRLVEYFQRGEGLDERKHSLLDGSGYARLVCFANRYVADRLQNEPDSVVELVHVKRHVRLEDAWQSGGVWSCYPVNEPRPAWMRIPSSIPIGTSRQGLPSVDEVVEELTPSDVEGPSITIKASQKSWRLALPVSAWNNNEFPVGKAISFFSQDEEKARFRLTVGGEQEPLIDAPVTLDREAKSLRGVPWPLDKFYPGIRIAAWVEKGGQAVRTSVTRLPAPLEVDGRRLQYEVDEAIYRRALQLDKLERPMQGSDFAKALSFAELIGRAFRRYGDPIGDRAYAISLMDLAVALLGPGPCADDIRPILAELRRMELKRDGNGRYLWEGGRITHRARFTDQALLEAYGESAGGTRLRRAVRLHWVRLHLRRWTHKGLAQRQHREESYKAEIARSRSGHRLAPILPEGFTYVEGHKRGTTDR